MAEQDPITIEMEPVRGDQEFGAAQPEPQQINGVTEEQMQLAAQFEQRYGQTAQVTAKQALEGETFDAELVNSANQFLQRAADRADDDRAEDLSRKQKQEWNGLVVGGTATPGAIAVSSRAASELTKDEIVTEGRGLRTRLDGLAAKLDSALDSSEHEERMKIRDEMKPLAKGENELRDEYFERDRAETRAVSGSWLEWQSMQIRAQAANSVFETPDEAALAAAYYNGRRETFNSARENFISAHPEAAERLPAAIQLDEVQVRTSAQAFETPSVEIAS